MADTPAKTTGLKRELTYSPSELSPSLIQAEKIAKTVTLSPEHSSTIAMSQLPEQPATTNTVIQLSDIVCSVINNPEFVNAIIPMVAEKVIESIRPKIDQIVYAAVQPHLEMIDQCKQEIDNQRKVISEQQSTISKLQDTVTNIGRRVEAQEQYSRRTSLRFNNVKVPTDNKGNIIKPINTDKAVLNICNEQLGLSLTENDLGRTHPIGEIKNGKVSIIVRFLSYRQRQLVFNNKKNLKNHPDKLFITENLTKYRYGLLKHLGTLRIQERIHSYWTQDGKIIIKETAQSGFSVVNSYKDIRELGGDVIDDEDF